MQDFKMSGSNMNELLTNMKAIKERIDDSYDELTRLMSRIESDELWKGKEKTTFMAYMGLMQQYHKSFSKANGDNPVQQAIDALKSHGDRVDDFYDEFGKLCRFKYNIDASAYFVSRYVSLSASMYREKLSYAYSSEIQNLSEKYTVFSNSDIEQRNIYDFVLSRLQQYGRCEQF
mgnify:FL=1